MKKALTFAMLSLGVALTAGTAGADPVTDSITEVQDTIGNYAVPLGGAILGTVVLFVGLPLIKRFAVMVRKAI